MSGTTIEAGHGGAFRMRKGDTVDIVAVAGPQVGDLWAFSEADAGEFLSTEHTRSCLDRLVPRVGEAFFSNRRNPMLTVAADTSPGVHDMLFSACDIGRYRMLGHEGPHRNCVDNFYEALATIGLRPPELPAPVNVFQNVLVNDDGSLDILPPEVAAGEALTLRAEFDLVLVVSACPMDIALTNAGEPKALLVRPSVARPAEAPRPRPHLQVIK